MPNNHSNKVCAVCGRVQGPHWVRHWSNNHPGAIPHVLPLGGVPTEPFKEDWLKDIEPSSLRDEYMNAAKILDEVPPT